MEKYRQQYAIVQKIVDTFRKPGYSDDKDGKEIAKLVGEMQDLGGPPQEIMGDLPEGFVREHLVISSCWLLDKTDHAGPRCPSRRRGLHHHVNCDTGTGAGKLDDYALYDTYMPTTYSEHVPTPTHGSRTGELPISTARVAHECRNCPFRSSSEHP